MYWKEKCGNIVERELILYGEQVEIEEFLKKYGSDLHIKCVLTDYKEVKDSQPYLQWGVRAVLFENMVIEEELIVICDHLNYESIYMRLEYLEKQRYVDYISCKMVDALMHDKKIIMFMGTQLLGQVSSFLKASKNITREWSVIYYSEDEIMEPYMNQMAEYRHISECCDAYVISDCEKDSYYLKKLDCTVLDSKCKVIKIADYGFAGYYPQINRNRNMISDYLIRERQRMERSYETLCCARSDLEIESMCKQGLSTEQILSAIASEHYFSEAMIKEHYASEIKRFKELEKDADVKLSDFLFENGRECLCRNLNEWNEPVISYVSECIIELLGLPRLSLNIVKKQKLIEEYSGSEILIYPCVRKTLGMADEIDDKEYKVTTFCRERKLKFGEYVRYMVEYIHRAIDIIEYIGY